MASAPTIPAPARAKLPTLYEFFSPEGILSKSSLAFEHLKGQYEMATAVESALNDKRHLIVETGMERERRSRICRRRDSPAFVRPRPLLSQLGNSFREGDICRRGTLRAFQRDND